MRKNIALAWLGINMSEFNRELISKSPKFHRTVPSIVPELTGINCDYIVVDEMADTEDLKIPLSRAALKDSPHIHDSMVKAIAYGRGIIIGKSFHHVLMDAITDTSWERRKLAKAQRAEWKNRKAVLCDL